ncbi:L,D-transpeptidase [Streptomyces sp. NPDC051546]|uniref:L,D-transpeptidase n=1 Tax=Streptomyces sp. NPDC051546 TaxID=3365655 RepID=UPI0037BB58B9
MTPSALSRAPRQSASVPSRRRPRSGSAALRLQAVAVAVAGTGVLVLAGCGGGNAQAGSGTDGEQAAAAADAASVPAAPARITAGPEAEFDLVPAPGQSVGIAQPVSLHFKRKVKNKAAVEKALTVTASDNAEGSWGWVTTPAGQERLDWRPKEYWKPGTHVRVTGDLTTVDPGGAHFSHPLDSSFTIGADQRLEADLDTHTLTVTHDGNPVQRFKMSGGEPVKDRASRPGTFVIKSKEDSVHMTSASVGGPKAYDTMVKSAMRFTDSGGYVHAAPWAEKAGDLGKRNKSAGCIGLSDANAAWVFKNTRLGDPLVIKGREATGPDGGPGNGYGDWNLTWDQWQTKSATHG